MAFEDDFPSDLGNWSVIEDVAWDAAGIDGPGCAVFNHSVFSFTTGGSMTHNMSYVVESGDYFSFYYRSVLDEFSSCNNGIILVGSAFVAAIEVPCPEDVGDTGWLFFSVSLEPYVGETIFYIDFNTIGYLFGATGEVYVDNVRLGSLPLGGGATLYYGVNNLAVSTLVQVT